ncbi:MAG: DUF975 family protein [Lachnospiraceae bacterium]
MWTRYQLKTKARERMRENYWKVVLVAIILMVIASGGNSPEKNDSNDQESQYEEIGYYVEEAQDMIWSHMGILQIFRGLTAILFFSAFTVGLVIVIFIFKPLEVGCKRFFIENLKYNATLRELLCGFEQNYLKIVKTMFLKGLYIFLWTLLLFIPGIIKSYEYRMIPYILADRRELTTEEAFTLSRNMMYGNKWDTFVLDMSFIGWYLLSGITLGIVGIFFSNPYKDQTDAALYQYLKENGEAL